MPAQYIETREVPLDELTIFPGNARRGDIPAIQASLRRNGQYRSLIVRQIDNGPLIVLAGNHTMQALKANGNKTARCEVVTCDEAEARRINLADNKLAEMGTYDDEALAELLESIGGDIDGTGYSSNDLAQILDTELPAGFPTYDESIAAMAPAAPAPAPAVPPAPPAPAPAAAFAQGGVIGDQGDEDEDRDIPELLLPEKQSADGEAGETAGWARFGGQSIIITDQEVEELTRRWRHYLETNGTDWGFFLWLCEGRPL